MRDNIFCCSVLSEHFKKCLIDDRLYFFNIFYSIIERHLKYCFKPLSEFSVKKKVNISSALCRLIDKFIEQLFMVLNILFLYSSVQFFL